VLTNGLIYRFFTDLEQPNKMDEKPFFEFNILDFKDRDVEELKKFAKSAFDIETILTTASELKYTRTIQNLLAEWITNPSEDFVRLLSSDLLTGRRFTPAVKDQFTLITKRAFEQLISERINERLKGAMAPEVVSVVEPTAATSDANAPSEAQTITTPEELEGFHIVRSILREVVSPNRVIMRDAQSYCAILLDDNNRKSICRLRFNNPQKLAIGLFNDKKEEERVSLENLDDLYKHAERLKNTVLSQLSPNDGAKTPVVSETPAGT
jgi:hypothetical protein